MTWRARWGAWRDRRRFARTVAAAVRADAALVVVAWSTPRRGELVASWAQGTGTRPGDRRVVRAFQKEYERVARAGA